VICLGYPLKGMGARAPLRDQVLLAMQTPVLFVQGTRDALCPLDLLAQVRSQMTAWNQLHVVEGGDHSLTVPKRELARRGVTDAALEQETLAHIQSFCERTCRHSSGRD
jgi:hypothetical protein